MTDSESDWSLTAGDDILVNFLSKNRTLLSKSSTPAVKAAKKVDMQIYGDHGIVRTDKQIRKSINNFKSRVRWKTDKNRTGNKPIKLSPQEQKFFSLLEPASNPAITRQEFGSSFGWQTPHRETPAINRPPSLSSLSTPESRHEAMPSPAPSYGSSSSRSSSIKSKSVSNMQKEVLEMQLKAANQQYQAAAMQKMYYAHMLNKHPEQATDATPKYTGQPSLLDSIEVQKEATPGEWSAFSPVNAAAFGQFPVPPTAISENVSVANFSI